MLAAASSSLREPVRESAGPVRWAGVSFLVIALGVYPLLAGTMGRPWQSAEVFGIAPDPTAVATLAFLSVVPVRWRALLMLLPTLWCAITGATLAVMGTADYLLAPLGALAAIGIAIADAYRDRIGRPAGIER